MRFFITLFVLSFVLYAKNLQTCYTVQLQSAPYSTKNLQKLSNSKYPTECTLMRISNALTLRCGCYEGYTKAKEKLPKYKKQYKYAYIATSYKYRFNKNAPSQKSLTTQSTQAYNSDEELKLMLQAFLYSNDLEHAYKTAKIGYRRHPHSYYWNQKMAEVCRWSGRGIEALPYMKFLYAKRSDSKLADEIIKYGLGAYQYEEIKDLVTQEAQKNPTNKNIERMVYVYTAIGEPDTAAKLLETFYKHNPNKIQYLDRALQIYMEMEDLEAVKRIIAYIQKKKLYDAKNVQYITYYYYSKADIQKAYQAASQPELANHYNKKNLQLISDLGWYLQDVTNAAHASLELIKHNDGRLVDYERVISYNRDSNKDLASHFALQAYEKFHLTYLFYLFANELIAQGDMPKLVHIMDTIDKNKHPALKKEAAYWLLKARVAHYKKKNALAKKALFKAIALSPDSLEIRFTVLSLFQEYGMSSALHQALTSLITNPNITPEFYFPLASFSYATHDVNLANYYAQRLLQTNNPAIKSYEFQFLLADIYKAQNNPNAAKQILNAIETKLKNDLKKDPSLTKTDAYLNKQLRISLDLRGGDDFEKALREAKPYLTKEHYNDLAYSFALKNNAQEQAHSLYLHMQHKPLWMEFSNAVLEQDHTTIENLLLAYLHILPIGDASTAAQNDGQISLAQSLSYTALNHNDANQNAYISLLSLDKTRADATDVKLSYYNRDPLLRKYVAINSSNYLARGYYLLSNLHYYKNSDLNKNILRQIPDDTFEFNIGVKKQFDKANINLFMGYANSMDAYVVASLFGDYQLTQRLNIGGGIYKNIQSDESSVLLLGGKKDMIEAKASYAILNSTAIDMLYEHNRYTSQDNHYIGSSEYAKFNLGHQIRNGYPDMRLSLFSDIAIYNADNTSRGLLENVQVQGAQILPNNFMDVGVNFAYGMQNSDIYTRVWRPYFEINSYYNTDLAAFSYGFNAGYGGKVYSQDHLILGTSYTNSVNGIGGSIFELFLKYKFLYTH